MKRFPMLFAVAAILALAIGALPADARDLETYVKTPDKSFAWKEVRRAPLGDATANVLHLTSQTWQDIAWRHRLVVIRPSELRYPRYAMLLIDGGSNRKGYLEKIPEEARLLAGIAEKTGAVMAVLSQVPNQPLFGDRHEDALIAYTFQKFLTERDPTWPLLLPMTKSAVRAMDAVQAFLAGKYGQRVERFFVTGASKRGWTTWLTGAVDGRVGAIAPMVIDVLNIPRQMKHQVDVWGAYSMSIGDYSQRGLTDMVQGDVARTLLDLVDPFSHRKKLAMPKLVMLGTNDSYWPVDAAKFYFFDLPGEKHLHYVPNAGHGLDLSIVDTLTGYFRTIVADEKRPRFDWHFESDGETARLAVRAETRPAEVRLFTAFAEKRDFRKAKWSGAILEADRNGLFLGSADVPEKGRGFRALYASLTFKTSAGEAYKLCTNVEVFPARLPGRGKSK